jgi:hypothetical protein
MGKKISNTTLKFVVHLAMKTFSGDVTITKKRERHTSSLPSTADASQVRSALL